MSGRSSAQPILGSATRVFATWNLLILLIALITAFS
jgi:hypothetical protein